MINKETGFCVEQSAGEKRWFVVEDRYLVVTPQKQEEQEVDYTGKVLSRLGAEMLERTPNPEEFSQFESIITTELSKPDFEEELKVRSFWSSSLGWPNMGAIFPELREGLKRFETLEGVLYPSSLELDSEFRVKSSDILETWLRAIDGKQTWCLTRLLSSRKQAHFTEQLIRPETHTHRLGVYGLGDIGKYVASILRALDTSESGLNALYLGGTIAEGGVTGETEDVRQLHLEGVQQPVISLVEPGNEEIFFNECDAIIILTAASIESPGEGNGEDVRSKQYEGNVKIIKEFIEQANRVEYDGQILIGSDPVEQLTMAAFRSLRERGVDVNNHQLAGFGGMTNRSRAKHFADVMGISCFKDTGRVFGPHGKMAVVVPTHDPRYFNFAQAEDLSLRTGHGNYDVRKKGVKPYLTPAVLIAEGIKQMFSNAGGDSHKILYASPFLPSNKSGQKGAFFGTRVKYNNNVGVWTPRVDQPSLPQIIDILQRAHEYTERTSDNPGALKIDPFGENEHHPAFHPSILEAWFDRIS